MFKRSVLLMLLLVLIAVSAGAAQAQNPFVNITSPTSGTVISNLGAVLNVSVNFGNAPEGGSGLLLRAWDDGEGTLFAQNATNDVSIIPWQTTLDFTATPPTPGTHGHLTAYMTDSGGNIIATSDPIQVTYGMASPPTATPTNTPMPPPPTSTPTNTPIPSSTQVYINVPSSGATVDPHSAISVSGGGASLNNTTVLVRLMNANNQVMGEQSVVPNPDPDDSWALTVTKTQNVPTTSSGSLIAYAMSGNTTVAVSNPVSVFFPGGGGGPTQTPQASVHITQPFNHAVVDITHSVHISGTSHNLPVQQVTVRAARADSSVIVEGTANVSNNGSWGIDLTVNVQPGTPGIIYVFARDSGNNLVAQDSINVTWGSSNVHPVIAITSPPQGAVVAINGTPIQVNGFAQGLFGNTLTVRALDTFGNVLSQQSVTTDQQGNWQTFLHVNAQPGSPGTLFAYATSSQSGAIIASASVNVFYGGQCFIQTAWPIYVVQAGDTLLKIAQKVGSTVTQLALANCINNANLVYTGQQLHVPSLPVTPLPPQVTLRILSPLANTQLDLSQPVTVSGDGLSLAGNNIVVRVLDTSGNLLAQQTTLAGPADINGDSQWLTSLTIPASNGTQGTIYAFAQSPSTGAVLADALVNVSFGSSSAVIVLPSTPAPGEKKLIITQPTTNASVIANGQLQVLGQVLGPIDGDVFVRVLDNQGNVIAEVQAVVSQADAQGNSNWQATLTINVQPGTRGTIFAYVPSPFDVTAMISDAVNVIFGQPNNGPFVSISTPLPYSTLDISQPITITGTGGALPNGTVVVRALDAQGNVLTETSTTLGAGTWQAALQVNVAVGTRGTIVAFSTTGTSNSIVAFASIYVTFGDPTTTANFVQINAPLPGTLVDPSQTLMIAGTADMQNGNSVKVQIVDDQGNVLVSQPRNLNPSENGNFGVWQMLVELKSMAAGTHLHIVALTTSRFDGSTLATDSVDIVVGTSSQPGS